MQVRAKNAQLTDAPGIVKKTQRSQSETPAVGLSTPCDLCDPCHLSEPHFPLSGKQAKPTFLKRLLGKVSKQ